MTPPIFSQFSSGGGGRAKGFGMGPMAGGGLYRFTTATFSGTGGNPDGPSLGDARGGLYGGETSQWKNDTNFFNTQSGTQLWTVPADGTYRIRAEGGRGGYPRGQGYGSNMRGDFALTEGEVIRIVVGQQGNTQGHPWGGTQGTGGGGTYVARSPYNSNGSILVVAGAGGAGTGTPWSNQGGDNANTGTSGNGGGEGGGSGGNGGNGYWGGSGAGFFGDGNTPSGTPSSQRARSFTNGSRGGRGPNSWGGTGWGAFGGGGGSSVGGGGGGGYSGGGSGQWSSQLRGGGGGSRNNGNNQSNSRSNRGGNGIVYIDFLG